MKSRLQLMRRKGGRDDGVIMVLTLIMLTVVGLLVLALLSSSDTVLRTSQVVNAGRSVTYSADGAVAGAINSIRSSATQGRDPADGGTCSSFTVPDTNGAGMRVDCAGEAGSGHVTVPGHSGGGTAIRLVGTNSGETDLVQRSNSTLRVTGNVEVNSNIDMSASNVAMDVLNGGAYATGTCPKTKITATDGVLCGPSDGLTSTFATPTQSPQTADLDLTVRSVPTCDSTKVVQTPLQPGQYQDAGALSSYTNCSRSVVRFAPGTYYFNFTSSSHVWTMSSATTNVVGGAATSVYSPVPPLASVMPLPTTDLAPLCDLAQDGVQFVFGGDSRLNISSGYLELCPRSADAGKTVIFGATSSTSATATTSPDVNPATASGSSFSNVATDALLLGDAKSASATVTNTASATATLSGYALTLPTGSTINSVQLKVGHRETYANGNAPTITAQVSGTGFSCSANVANSTAYTVGNQSISCLNSAARLAGFNVAYTMTVGNNKTATSALDGIAVVVNYTPPGIAQESGCITAAGYGPNSDSTHCPVLQTAGNNTGLVLHGGIYSPDAVLDIALPGASVQKFENGLIARAARLQVNPSTIYVGRVIYIPAGSSLPEQRADRTVDFVAYDSANQVRLRAQVVYDDNAGQTPGRAVTIATWTVATP